MKNTESTENDELIIVGPILLARIADGLAPTPFIGVGFLIPSEVEGRMIDDRRDRPLSPFLPPPA